MAGLCESWPAKGRNTVGGGSQQPEWVIHHDPCNHSRHLSLKKIPSECGLLEANLAPFKQQNSTSTYKSLPPGECRQFAGWEANNLGVQKPPTWVIALGGGFKDSWNFQPYLGKWSNLASIFTWVGSTHQLVMVRNQELKYHPPKKSWKLDNSAGDLFWEVNANRDFKTDPGFSFLLLMESCWFHVFFLGQNHKNGSKIKKQRMRSL